MTPHDPSSSDTHDESYFASFTDMLVGILFIFIILLMLFANNYQQATESVTRITQDLEDARTKANAQAQQDSHDREIAEAKLLEAAKALEEARALVEAATPIIATPDPKAVQEAKANDDVLIGQLRAKQQNIFNDARALLLRKLQEALGRQGFAVTIDTRQGALMIPETLLFDANQAGVNYRGRQAAYTLAMLLGKYLPCVSPTPDAARLADCSDLGFAPNDGIDAVYLDDYPAIDGSNEDKLLLAVQRAISVFNELKTNEPYLDKGLKNIYGVPILNVRVSQERRKAWNQEQSDPAVRNSFVLRFSMRGANQRDIMRLRNTP